MQSPTDPNMNMDYMVKIYNSDELSKFGTEEGFGAKQKSGIITKSQPLPRFEVTNWTSSPV